MARIPVGILGATGVVGQRFIQMLDQHPWFEVAWLAASERSAGLPYVEAARWKLPSAIPEPVARMTLSSAAPGDAPRVIFAALDAAAAAELEPRFAAAGKIVVTNSSALRMNQDVPLVIPEVNPDHLALIERQSWRKQSGGFAVTNPNCTAIGLVMALAPLRQFGLEKIFMTSMQAVSGAGYPGVPTLDILGNVVPYIANEEVKVEAEVRKLLGDLSNGAVTPAAFGISAHCNRVPVEDGHTECVSVKLARKVGRDEILRAWGDYRPEPQKRKLPSAPEQPVLYLEQQDRPQPKLDVNNGRGMATTIGRLRECNLFDWKFVVLSHNTIRGAAGAAVLNAELLHARGLLA